ncbi:MULTISPECIES: DoxX family protein [unclassified Meridianimarinicoccus]|uniref:DoxX family protein n=1 Tax=unclassified Meridianimarinicoccus TaxID=2923344 RepID=UPI0018677830|nr:DoxX family membrane protein [Fluviibacterium sp. MJW13]
MKTLVSLYNSVFGLLERATDGWLTPTLARLVFAGTLLVYYWASAMTKIGDGIFGFLFPSAGAYIQIFPKAMEAAGYDTSQLGFFHWLVVLLGTYAEFLLPLMIVIGLLTRAAALGMIGFVIVQSWVDITGHGLAAKDIGAWFDRDPSSLIVDQRSFWIFLLLVLVLKGAGPFAADRFVLNRKVEV